MTPNDHLDNLAVEHPDLDDPVDLIALPDGDLVVAAGTDLHRRHGADWRCVAKLPKSVTAIAAGPEGEIYAAVEDIGVLRVEADGRWESMLDISGVTALTFGGQRLYVAEGSRQHGPGDWARDLMSEGISGRVLSVDLTSGAFAEIAGGLAWPAGLSFADDGGLLVSEAWAHRILHLDVNSGRRDVLSDNLAGYPTRLSATSHGAYWVSFLSLRNALVEFVLSEPEFRDEMLSTLDPDQWVRPMLSTTGAPREPMQIGAAKHLGRVKAWAPTFSYGLCARFKPSVGFQRSLHARAGSARHGVTAAVEHDGVLYVVSRGASLVLRGEVPA